MHLTRRSALASGVAVLVAACTPNKRAAPAAVDPDNALREAAVERERALLAVYRDALAAAPTLSAKLAPLLADHESHLAALGGVTEAAPTATPGGARTPAAVLTELRAAERTAAAAHATATLTASRQLAATLASLAACEASHGAVL